MNKKIKMIIAILVVIAGIVLFIVGLNYEIPRRTFSFTALKEYVGGDAYNAMIEASLRGGEIAAATISKTIYICTGILTVATGLLIATVQETNKKQDKEIENKTELN